MKNSKPKTREMEEKWTKVWEEKKIYQPDLKNAKNPFFNLMMFPYPSAEGLHVGNVYAFTGADVYGRFMRMNGNDVFEPIGLDGFGIHSENYALKIGKNPADQAKISEKNFYRQLKMIGNSFDWAHTVETYDPEYYKWTQWIFLKLFKAGLAEKRKAPVNWCPSCKTVLADEQVIQKSKIKNKIPASPAGRSNLGDEENEERMGVCERCETPVEIKDLEQWFFKITAFADRLLEDLKKIDWSEKVITAQRNWIGRKTGTMLSFESELGSPIEVFTTRPDTFHGVTFIVISPYHPVLSSVKNLENDVLEYIEKAKSSAEKAKDKTLKDEKTGVFSGYFATHPLSGNKIPVWIADYVLMDYGTGAVMGVPAHDSRDFDFAKKYDLPIVSVIGGGKEGEAYEGSGEIINSSEWNGWESPQDIPKIIDWLEKKGIGSKKVSYHLRDWLISRQRYWGAPIPMIFCDKCARLPSSRGEASGGQGWQAVPEEDLPVILPYIKNFKPLGIHSRHSAELSRSPSSGQAGEAPLSQDKQFIEAKCPNCGGVGRRETDVCDTFLDSSWYFLRYPVSDFKYIPFPSKNWENPKSQIPKPKTDREIGNWKLEIGNSAQRAAWLPVHMYIGGAEHSVLHLLYSRFIAKALFDLGFLAFDEPFSKFRAHGLLIKDGGKMSKSRGNVVNPDQYIERFGTDALRTYLMFLGPFDQGGDFRDAGIEGMERFLRRVDRLINYQTGLGSDKKKQIPSLDQAMNKTIREVTDDLQGLRYNTAIAHIMEYVNELTREKSALDEEYLKNLIFLLAPFAPFYSEEWFQSLSEDKSTFNSVHLHKWPEYDPENIIEDIVIMAIQVNGKTRDILEFTTAESKSEALVKERALASEKVKRHMGSEPKKVIYVEGKIINFVV